MTVRLKQVEVADPQLREVQQNVADAVAALSSAPPPAVGVLGPVTASRGLVGNEDVVLVNSSAATAELFLVLPPVKLLQRILRVKVSDAGSFPVSVKAVDIPQTTSPKIDGGNVVSIPSGTEGSLSIVSDGRNFHTI